MKHKSAAESKHTKHEQMKRKEEYIALRRKERERQEEREKKSKEEAE